ncbi:MAG: hypothetical protein NVS3B25_30960 [Hymenobacter sp.]
MTFSPTTKHRLYYLALGLTLGWALAIHHDAGYLTERHFWELVTANVVFAGYLWLYRDLLEQPTRRERWQALALVVLLAMVGMGLASWAWSLKP